MAHDARREDYLRMSLRFALSLDEGSPDHAARAFASFGRRFAQSRDSLPQSDADRAFHLVSLATELLEKGRVHLDEIYSQRMYKYYPGDLILHDNGERATYYLSFRGGKK